MRMDLLSYDNENLLINFPPCLRKNFEELFCNGKIGLSPFTLNDISFNKQYTENNASYSYYYTLKIPYAGKKLSWELIFDPEDMTFAPDFNFNDDNFHMSHDLDMIMDNIPSLVNWNINDPKALITVLSEFLDLFKKQQLERLQKENIYSQLNIQYQQLIEEISPNDVEIYLENTCAHLLVNIKVKTTQLPEYVQPLKEDQNEGLLNPGEDKSILKISYMKLDGSRVNTSLQISPKLEQVFGNVKSFHVPAYTKTTSLVEYVSLVTKLIQDQIKRVEQHHKLKTEYMNCLCTMFSEKMIEFDSKKFSKAVFLCEVDDYYCLVHINIGNMFPQEKPTIILQSVYCMGYKKPCSEELEDYPYSPRWTPQVMLERMINHLIENIQQFKNHNH